MYARSNALLKDRRGISSTTTAALFAIAVLLIFMTSINNLGNDQNLFITVTEFFKAINILPEDFDPWEILNSPVGPLAAYIGAYVCMLFAVIGTYVIIKWPLQAASEISAWRRGRREKEQKILEIEERERKLWREKLEREDEDKSALRQELTRSERLGFMGYPMQKGSWSYGEDVAKELLEEAEFVRKRITLSSVSLWFPFEPIGYIIATSFGGFWNNFWSVFLVAWIIKAIILRVGGSKLY